MTRLVLTRRVNETIVIGEGAMATEMTVIFMDRGQVTLSFTGPRAVKIHRKELRDRINAEIAQRTAPTAP